MPQRLVLGGVVVFFWGLIVALGLVLLGGCSHEQPPPPVPPPPEDLSLWSVPELVQAPAPEEPKPSTPREPQPTAAEKILDFQAGTTYDLAVSVGAPLDIVLGPHESLRNLVGGDRSPVEANQTTIWEVKEGMSGLGETQRQHVFLSVAKAGVTTGLVITTTQRTYYITCKSVQKTPIRTVRWRYPVEVAAVQPVKKPGLLPDPMQPKQYHVGYEVKANGHMPDWHPRYVLDDGKKTYIIYPEFTLFETIPMLRLIGPNGPQVVNSRQFLNVVIVDQLVPRAELRVGVGEHAETVTITRGALHTIACPGDDAGQCPVWPQAAQVLAQRHPPVQPPVTVQGEQPPPGYPRPQRPAQPAAPAPPPPPPAPPHAEVAPPAEGVQP
jgi:type IV secretion system protein VirB9